MNHRVCTRVHVFVLLMASCGLLVAHSILSNLNVATLHPQKGNGGTKDSKLIDAELVLHSVSYEYVCVSRWQLHPIPVLVLQTVFHGDTCAFNAESCREHCRLYLPVVFMSAAALRLRKKVFLRGKDEEGRTKWWCNREFISRSQFEHFKGAFVWLHTPPTLLLCGNVCVEPRAQD